MSKHGLHWFGLIDTVWVQFFHDWYNLGDRGAVLKLHKVTNGKSIQERCVSSDIMTVKTIPK